MDYTKPMLGRNLVKMMKAVQLLSRLKGATISDFKEELGISERSVYRLIRTLEELGFPFENKKPDGRTTRYHLMENYLTKLPNLDIPNLSLSREELLVLYLLISRGNVLGSTELNHHLGSLRLKLASSIPLSVDEEKARKRLDDVFIPVYQGIKDYHGKEELIDDIITAAVEYRTCEAEYHSFSRDEVHSLRFNPLKLYEWNGGLYCFAELLPEKAIHTLALDRIKEHTLTKDIFEFPKDFNPEEILESAFTITAGDPLSVKIRFEPHTANYIRERRWAKTQTLTENEDGSVTLAMATSGRRDVKSWILSFGPDAAVLEPEDLKEEIKQDILKMKKNYL